ncbi:MAG TPA: FHA domain-containing protein [Planctomycetaceae bacterium]|nr:FHA domain-containing protein [Planctomycetaceae bacterium]
MALYLVPVDQGRPIVLDKAVVFIGRHPECDVVLKSSRKVSRKHCCIAQVDSRIVVRDLGSMNGIRLNGERVQHEATVRLGDQVTIGDMDYVLQTHEALAGPRAPRPPQPPNGRQTESAQGPSAPPARPPSPPRRPEDRTNRPRRDRPVINPPLALSQDMPVPIPDEDADFRIEESRYRSDPDPRGDDEDVVLLSDSDEA